ncbi:hypothetical protein CRG98_035034 [Punica granatum]|uniref:Uncharacterized protein n=1 Tax=Punica granatum TaxID=22663 RepID=A0A2I0ILE8_PUNGR|nr:hypothetical protein CRG98_035034 [Punica granatum]
MDLNDRNLDRMDPNERNLGRIGPNDLKDLSYRNLDRKDPNDRKDLNGTRMDLNDRDGPEYGVAHPLTTSGALRARPAVRGSHGSVGGEHPLRFTIVPTLRKERPAEDVSRVKSLRLRCVKGIYVKICWGYDSDGHLEGGRVLIGERLF